MSVVDCYCALLFSISGFRIQWFPYIINYVYRGFVNIFYFYACSKYYGFVNSGLT